MDSTTGLIYDSGQALTSLSQNNLVHYCTIEFVILIISLGMLEIEEQ